MPRTLTKPRYKTTQQNHARALEALRLEIPLGPGRQQIPADERFLRLLDRFTTFYRPSNLFQGSLSLFCSRLVYTKDEAAGGQVARMPDWQYLREMDEAVLTQPLLLIEKSRRVLASWRMCATDIWLAAGGQDPRWPATMNSTSNRRVILAARKIEDVGGSAWFLATRVRFILEEFEHRNLRSLWPEFPSWTAKFNQIAFSNGSVIDCVPSGPDQIRGAGATLLHCEEVAFWENAGPTVAAALPALRGGGHIVCVTTPQAQTYAHRIVTGRLKQSRYGAARA